jgi:nucleoside 2-deoxyribosyltransferase
LGVVSIGSDVNGIFKFTGVEVVCMKVFLAAPLFSEAEREFNFKVAASLRENGFEVWLAQDAISDKREFPMEKGLVFEDTVAALKACEVMVAVLDGVDVDSGVAFEVGYAKAFGKRILGLKTDHRSFSRMQEVNLMLEFSLMGICASVSEIVDLLNSRKDDVVPNH